jgi:hypothetical protein
MHDIQKHQEEQEEERAQSIPHALCKLATNEDEQFFFH